MKKFVAILLTLMLVLGIGAAVADEGPATPTTDLTDHGTVTIKKVYKLVGAGTSPAETFTLEQVGVGRVTDGDATSAPALGTITGAAFNEGAATADGTTIGNITVALPGYTNVGVYEYTLQEVAGNTAGVIYYGKTIKLVVTVINGENGKLRIAAVHTESEDEEKSDKFVNTYRAGTLNVSKTVTGNMGDKNKYFEFDVTLTGEEGKAYGESYVVSGGSKEANNPASIKIGEKTTFKLKHGDTLSIANLPYGVTYTVTEVDAKENEKGVLMNGDYEVTKTGDSGTIGAASQTAAFTNTKTGEIDTGVTTENLPYVLLIGFVVLAGAALLIKRKAHNN